MAVIRSFPIIGCGITAALTTVCVMSLPAHAGSLIAGDDPRLKPATIHAVDLEGFSQIFIDGYIHAPTVEALKKRLAASHNDRGIVYFNSGGGDIYAAMELGRLIRDKGFATQIGKLSESTDAIANGACESACPIAFIGGKHRLVDTETGNLAVHSFYQASSGQGEKSKQRLFTAGRDLRGYIEEMGIDPEFYELISRTPADELVTVGLSAARYWNIATASHNTSWVENGANELSGENSGVLGKYKMTLTCQAGTVTSQSEFKPWFPAGALLNYEVHSLTIDGESVELESVNASYDKQAQVIRFSTKIEPNTAALMRNALSIGYKLSYETQHGGYRQTLQISSSAGAYQAFWDNCLE